MKSLKDTLALWPLIVAILGVAVYVGAYQLKITNLETTTAHIHGQVDDNSNRLTRMEEGYIRLLELVKEQRADTKEILKRVK